MKSKNGIKGVIGAMLMLALVGCDETTGTTSTVETVVRDSVVVHDSVRVIDNVQTKILDSVSVKDSLNVVDSVRIIDSVRVIDSINVVDSVRVIDSVNVIDSIRVIDSVRVVDSVHVVDSVTVRDSIAVHDPEYYFGECTAENAGVIKSTTINGTVRSFICDKLTLLWRSANKVDWNDKYIYDSQVSEFTSIEVLVHNLASTDKMILVLRHAERGSDYSITGPLNENGKKQGVALGKSLADTTLEFYYGASQFVRAHQTCNSIAKGRGELDTLADTLAVLNDDWFVKDEAAYKSAKDAHGGGWKVTSEWAYEGTYSDAFYNLEARSTELLDGYLIPAFENSGKQVGLFVSHDVVMVPLVVYASGKNIDLKYYKNSTNRWLNYLGGIAIVFKPDGTRVFYAVKGLESGTM